MQQCIGATRPRDGQTTRRAINRAEVTHYAGMRYTDLEPYLGRYELVYLRVFRIVEEQEKRQIRESKGMTVADCEVDEAAVLADVARQARLPRRPCVDTERAESQWCVARRPLVDQSS
jgi:hypothetical protein